MSEKLFTQEEVNALVGKAREEGRTSKAKEFDGWLSPKDIESKTAELNGKVASLTSALESANSKLAENEATIADKDKTLKGYENRAIKSRVAHEVGLSFDAIEFLQGEDEESIRKSADTLKNLVGVNNIQPMANPEKPIGGDSKEKAYKDMLKDLGGN